MARQTPLGQVLAMLKAEVSKSLNTSATQQDPYLYQIIADTQQWLGSEYDWPFLQSRWDITISPGSRYLAFPTVDDYSVTAGIDFERAGNLKLYVKWTNVWQEVDYGINEIEQFNYIDSDLGQTLDPVQRWMFSDEADFEIWPINATTQLLRFTGQRQLLSLLTSVGPPPVWNTSALLDLDDLLVTYYAAAEIAAREQQTEIAQEFMKRGAARLLQVRATYPQKEVPPTIVGRDSQLSRKALRQVPMVVVART